MTAPIVSIAARLPVVIHIPHASVYIPDEARRQFMLSPDELAQELILMTDRYTDELYALPDCRTVVYPYSRLLADPERFSCDADEPMAARGMGAVYMKTARGRTLRRMLTAAERDRCLQDYYAPHHARLTTAVRDTLDAHARCLIIDAHSFPSFRLPCDMDQEKPRPDICIGTDHFHTPGWMTEKAAAVFMGEGWTVGINAPYSGALVPQEFYRHDRRVLSVMIEINRYLYMDEATGEKGEGFSAFQSKFQNCLRQFLSMSGS